MGMTKGSTTLLHDPQSLSSYDRDIHPAPGAFCSCRSSYDGRIVRKYCHFLQGTLKNPGVRLAPLHKSVIRLRNPSDIHLEIFTITAYSSLRTINECINRHPDRTSPFRVDTEHFSVRLVSRTFGVYLRHPAEPLRLASNRKILSYLGIWCLYAARVTSARFGSLGKLNWLRLRS
jgi:hypothetical protein